MRPAVAMVACAVGCGPSPVGEASDHNVLVIVADDLGVDQLALYGRHPRQPATPNIERLAARGVTFRDAWAYPVCSPTRASMLTGRYARRHGVGSNIVRGAKDELPLESVLLPEVLRDQSPHGYAHHARGKWHLATYNSPLSVEHPTAQGFDTYAGGLTNLTSYHHWPKVGTDGLVRWTRRYATSDTVDDAIAAIDEAPAPWFAWVAFHAPHAPFHTPPHELHGPVDPDDEASLYRAAVEALDTEIGRLLDMLAPEVLDRATVIFLGDNGTPSEAVIAPFDPARAKITVFDGGVHVPLIVTSPEVDRGGVESDSLVHAVDVFATVLDIADVAPEDLGHATDGISLRPWLADPAAPSGREVLFSERMVPRGPPPYDRDNRTIRDRGHKLVVKSQSGEPDQVSLFALVPGAVDEGNDLLEGPEALLPEHQDALGRLRVGLAAFEGLPYDGW